jgi:hypothetical protein
MHLLIFPFVAAGLFAKIRNRKITKTFPQLSINAKTDKYITTNIIPLSDTTYTLKSRETFTHVKNIKALQERKYSE